MGNAHVNAPDHFDLDTATDDLHVDTSQHSDINTFHDADVLAKSPRGYLDDRESMEHPYHNTMEHSYHNAMEHPYHITSGNIYVYTIGVQQQQALF